MRQTLEVKGWFAAARCGGIFRYHLRTLGKTVAWVLGVTLGWGLLLVLLPLLLPEAGASLPGGIYANLPLSMLFALICGMTVAGRSTRFLLRFGTPRFSVWLCNVLSLLAAMLLLLAGSLLVSAVLAYAALPVSGHVAPSLGMWSRAPEARYNAAFLAESFSRALAQLPTQALWLAEYVCVFYLLGCCLRRARALTLTVVLGVPFAFVVLLLVPAVQDAIDVVMGGRQAEIALAGLQWVQWLIRALDFLEEEWPSVLLGVAAASLPLSYLCMRGTRQP